jgi:hypothetical protein
MFFAPPVAADGRAASARVGLARAVKLAMVTTIVVRMGNDSGCSTRCWRVRPGSARDEASYL